MIIKLTLQFLKHLSKPQQLIMLKRLMQVLLDHKAFLEGSSMNNKQFNNEKQTPFGGYHVRKRRLKN